MQAILSKLCEVIGDIPGIGSAICSNDSGDTNPTPTDTGETQEGSSDNILSGTPFRRTK